MGILHRVINIISNELQQNDDNTLFDNEIETLLNADDDELSDMIDSLPNKQHYNSKNDVSANISIDNSKLTLQDALNILELPDNATLSDAKQHFKDKIKIYHPDIHRDIAEKDMRYYSDKTSELIVAYNIVREFIRNK